MLKMIVRVGLVIAVVAVVVTVFSHYHGQNCQMIGTRVADAGEDCLHQDAISTNWAEAQQQQLTMAWAPVTTGLLFTEASKYGCDVLIELILPKGSTMVVWWPGGHNELYSGKATL